MRCSRLEVDSLGEATGDECEFHLGEGEADAHPWTAPERHPGIVGECSLCPSEICEPLRPEVVRSSPGVGIASGQVRRPQRQRALRYRVVTHRDVGRCLASPHARSRMQAQALAHHAVGELQPDERCIVC